MAVSFLLGTAAYNTHVQQIGRALHEAGALAAYVTAGVDSYRHPLMRRARGIARHRLPGIDRELRRRTVTEIPQELIHSHWRWDLPRVAAGRLGSVALEDWIWERGEFALDAHCAKLLRNPRIGGFLGVEHGALASLRAARQLGKPAVVAFLSPHHRTYAKWVEGEYAKHPDLSGKSHARLTRLAVRRNARRDEEMAVADWIVSGSSFTTRSLTDAGVPPARILTIPLGGPTPVAPDALPAHPPQTVRFLYVGPMSVRKGAHYLLNAWRRVARPGVELHFFGKRLLPVEIVERAKAAAGGDSIVVHGSVPGPELAHAYMRSSILVLPTLCDGFGQVISDALGHGLPVITTSNAGAADLVQHGTSGFVVPPADEHALVDAMTWCADHPGELFAMRHAALTRAAKWTWLEFRQRFRDLLLGAMELEREMAG
jgi:glycosyltransferase involved in cell wall biosynthesis